MKENSKYKIEVTEEELKIILSHLSIGFLSLQGKTRKEIRILKSQSKGNFKHNNRTRLLFEKLSKPLSAWDNHILYKKGESNAL